MALGTLGTALATSAVTAGANFGLSKLFGGKKGEAQAGLQPGAFAPTGFSAGGLTSGMSNGNITITPSGQRLGLVGDVANTFAERAGLLSGLRDSVAPGISGLRASRLAEIDNARKAAIGNLRENMARRRVLGSSFGQDAIARAEKEFGQERERVAAESFLQELELTNQLINQEFEARRQQFQTGLDELNLQADVATKLAGVSTQQMGANARLLAELNAKEAAGAGKFFGETFGPFTKALGNSVAGFLGGGSNVSSFMQGGQAFPMFT